MRKISLQLLSAIMLGTTFTPAVSQKVHAQEVVTSYQTFYDQLSPYGQWVSDAQYGDVWVPNVAAGFRPYATNGHWVMTDYGNMWVSDDPYGWACYHYGRWTYNTYYGWVWIPGHDWAPAWVSWRSGNGFYGWAPMEPGFEAGGAYQCPDNYWVFVTPEYLYHPNVYSYYDPSRNFYYCQHTAYIHDTYNDHGMVYNYGPRREVIEQQTHQPVQVYQVSSVRSPRGTRQSGNVVQIYRPSVNPGSERTSRPANVMTARQPIGKAQDIPNGRETALPAFRQQMQQHPNNYPGAPGRTQAAPQNNIRTNDERGQQPANNTLRQQYNQPNNRPQAQHFQQYNVQQAQQQNADQNNQRMNQQMNNQPRYNQQPGNQQTQRPQPQMQQQQTRPQYQMQQQQPQRPQPQPQRPAGTQMEGNDNGQRRR